MSSVPIYMDYAATTPVDERVAEQMLRCLTREGNYGNAASRTHVYGWRAEEAVENARRQVADLIGADPREIVFTSGATEANNLALKGAAQARVEQGRHIVSSRIEHKAVLDTLAYLETQGFEVELLTPDRQGRIAVDKVKAALREDTVLVSLMHANNEVGTLNPVQEVGALCRERGIVFHVDAAQSAGKLNINVAELNVDLLSLTAHKFYGPKGSAALYVRRHPTLKISAQMHGGGHERGLRSGTLATHQIVGLGAAAQFAREGMQEEYWRLHALKQRFLEGIESLERVQLNGDTEHSLPGITNLSFIGCDAEQLMIGLRDFAVSSGSACTSASVEPSYVLLAMGVEKRHAHASLRFSFGRYTREADIDLLLEKIQQHISVS